MVRQLPSVDQKERAYLFDACCVDPADAANADCRSWCRRDNVGITAPLRSRLSNRY